MCFDMIMEKNNVKLNSSRRTKCVSADLRMRSNDEEDSSMEASTKRLLRRRGLRATVRKALRSSKATVRKQQHQKRLQVMCLVEVVDAGQKTTEDGHDNVAFTRFAHGSSPPRVPSSAMMAPANTTQYLMADVDDDQFDFQSTTTSTVSPPGLYGEDLSPSSVYVSLDNTVDYETCLAFQQRSFEAELCAYSCC